MKNKIIRIVGLIGLAIILLLTGALNIALAATFTKHSNGRDALFSAFGGAFFAYIFVRLGELFNRISKREKLNLDTLVEVEYVLNDHLNRIGQNINILEALLVVVDTKSPVVNFMRIKPIPNDKSGLQDLKNLDFINDLFSYFVDLEKINEGFELVLQFAIKMINDDASMRAANLPQTSVQANYQMNSDALKDMANDTKNLLLQAEKDCVELIAKSRYVYDHRNMWIALAYSGKVGGHYGEDLDDYLKAKIKELEKTRDDNNTASKKKTEKTLGKKVKN